MDDERNPNNPFESFGFDLTKGFDLSQFSSLIPPTGPVNLDVARQIAQWAALHTPDGVGVVDAPESVAAFEATASAALAQIAAAADDPSLRELQLLTHTRREWAEAQLQELTGVLASLSNVVASGFGSLEIDAEIAHEALGGIDASFLQAMMSSIAPTLVGSQAGALLGSLSHLVLGRYDLAVPASGTEHVWIIPSNLRSFAATWDLDLNDLTYTVVAHEALHTMLRKAPAFRNHFDELVTAYANGYAFDPERLAASFANPSADPENPLGIGSIDPVAFLEAMQTDAQTSPRGSLRRFVALSCGIVDAILERFVRPMVATFPSISEARKRHRIECSSSSAFLEALLGVNLERSEYESGASFVQGVLDRADLEGLAQLWHRSDALPTESEFQAPGLWLARIELAG